MGAVTVAKAGVGTYGHFSTEPGENVQGFPGSSGALAEQVPVDEEGYSEPGAGGFPRKEGAGAALRPAMADVLLRRRVSQES